MIKNTPFVSLLVAAAVLSCADGRKILDPSPGQPSPGQPSQPGEVQPMLTAKSFLAATLIPGDPIPSPEVRVIDRTTSKPIAGIKVTFTAENGEVANSSVMTDADGTARAGEWRPDFTKSPTVIANAEGASNPLTFSVTILNKKLVGQYELKLIGGKSLPITYSGGGSSWTVTGGGYRLFDDGTYTFGYEIDHVRGWNIPLSYLQADGQIAFYLNYESAPESSFYKDRAYLFAMGVINGNTMTVQYTDPVDFEEEVYVAK
jgi:hypothetical protein